MSDMSVTLGRRRGVFAATVVAGSGFGVPGWWWASRDWPVSLPGWTGFRAGPPSRRPNHCSIRPGRWPFRRHDGGQHRGHRGPVASPQPRPRPWKACCQLPRRHCRRSASCSPLCTVARKACATDSRGGSNRHRSDYRLPYARQPLSRTIAMTGEGAQVWEVEAARGADTGPSRPRPPRPPRTIPEPEPWSRPCRAVPRSPSFRTTRANPRPPAPAPQPGIPRQERSVSCRRAERDAPHAYAPRQQQRQT
jgi:hypothetical protein